MIQLQGPHRRYNPLLDEWVLCSPQRIERPWQGQVAEAASPVRPAYDPACYLCPGNTRANGQQNPHYAGPFAFDNDFPAVHPGNGREALGTGLLRAHAESGMCRVICFAPEHDLALARMSTAGVRAVVDCWAEESARIGSSEEIGHVQIFENKGEMMGCSNPHPHSQLWGTAHVPTVPTRMLATQAAYFERTSRDMLGDYLAQELRLAERVIFDNAHFTALVPFWAIWPFEAILVPNRPVADLVSLDDGERQGLADALRRLTVRYDNVFRCEFPYSMGIAQQPTNGVEHPGWRLHVTFRPPLLRSATVRKFLVGYEMAAEPQRDVSAEAAADQLRRQAERHYLLDGAD